MSENQERRATNEGEGEGRRVTKREIVVGIAFALIVAGGAFVILPDILKEFQTVAGML